MAVDLSIGIVVYHPDLTILKKTLQHIEVAGAGMAIECYLINNAPREQALAQPTQFIEQFSLTIKLINNPKNTGYGAGNNLAINITEAKYHLVLNPDAFLHKDALSNALAYMDNHPEVGLLCPKVLNEDGSQQFVHRQDATLFDMFLRSFAPGFIKKMFAQRMNHFLLKDLDWHQEQNIPSPSGCCMLFRTSVLKNLSGFDERFFMYYEDSDLGRRLRQIAEIKYLPGFQVTHLWARDSHKSWHMRLLIIKSGWYYFRKWGGWF
jgi:GT2 family glycosyltransferase